MSAPTLVTVTVGTGQQYATLAAFRTFINSRDLIANNETYVVNVYNDQTVTGLYFTPTNTDNTHYVVIQPAPGLGVDDLDSSGPLYYGTQGIQLTCNTSSAWFIGSGVAIRGFRILVNGTSSSDTTAIYMSKYSQTNGNSVVQDIQYCRFSINSLARTIMDGNNGGNGRITDNLFIYNNAAATSLVYLSSANGTFSRNTVVGTNGGHSPIGTYANSVFKDNVFVNCGAKTFTGPEQGALNGTTFSNNFSDSSADSAQSGLTVNTGVGALVQNLSSDLRPTAGGPLIAAASASSQGTYDVRKQYRGTIPDVGGSQLTAQALPVPTAVVTSQTVVGETLTISGTTTNAPTSGTITFASTTGGATYGPSAITLGSGTFSYSLPGITPDTYAAPTISLTNSYGSGTATGSTPFVTVLPLPPSVTITSEVVNNQSITISGTTTGGPTSATIALATDTTPNGAVAISPTAVTLGNGTFTITFPVVSPGNYAIPVVSFTNAAGTTTTSTGGTTFTIPPVVIPTVTITSQTVTNQSIVISGTTTGNPTSGTIALAVGSPANGAVAVAPTAVTLGNGTFTVTLSGLTPGNYAIPVVSFGNSAGTVTTSTGGTTITIPQFPAFPTVTITSQTITNQTVIISGTTTGIPTAGSISVAIGATPNGAVAVGPISFTPSAATFTAILYGVTPGNYAAPSVTVSNTFGTSTPATGGTTFTVNPVAVGGNTVKTVGTGKDFATLKTFATWLQTKSLVGDNENVTVYVYENQPFATTANTNLTPQTSSAANSCTIRPAVGMGVNELDTTGAAWFPSVGILLQTHVYAPLTSGPFVTLTGFLVDVVYDGAASNSYDYGLIVQGTLQYNRIRSNTNAPAVVAGIGANVTNVADNFFLQTGGTGTLLLNGWSGTTQRNTFVRTGSATGLPFTNNSYNLGYMYNNVFVNGGSTLFGGSTLAGINTNFTDNALTTGISGVTYAANLVTNAVSDIRPAAGGPLIGVASSTAISTNDLRGNNRGPYPDVGAIQLSSALPLPQGIITSQVLNGQQLVISGTTTGIPASGSISIAPSATPNGAVAIAPTAVNLSSGAFTVTLNGITPGNYSAPAITFTNSGGTGSNATGGVGFTINGITGTPVAPAAPAPVGPTLSVITITSQVVTGSTITIAGTTTGSPTAGTIALAVGTTPNGAVAVAPTAVTLGSGTFSVTITGLAAGNYAAPVVAFTNAAGIANTSTGGTTFTIASITPPILTIGTLVISADTVSVTGTINFSGDANGTLNLYFNSQTSSNVLGPFTPVIVGNNWSYSGNISSDVWNAKATALANTVTVNATTANTVAVISLVGSPSFPAVVNTTYVR